MCGHTGVAGTLEAKHVNTFNDLIEFTSVRGRDSTGVASVDRDQHKDRKDTYMFKDTGPAVFIKDYKNYDRVVNQARVAIIGHCRSATIGKVTRNNAHPFEFDQLIGAHNGTFPWSEQALLTDHNKFGTDSEALFSDINDKGVQAVIPTLQGAWALVWYDKVDHSINFLRNEERPLVYALVNDGKVLIWASEAGMLHAAAERRGVETAKCCWHVPENYWMKFKIPVERGGVFETPEQVKVLARKDDPKKVAPFQSYAYGVGHNHRGSSAMDAMGEKDELPFVNGRRMDSIGEVSKVVALDVYKKNKKVGVERKITGFDGKPMGEDQFKASTGSTCGYCDSIHDWSSIVKGDVKIKFLKPNFYVCEECDDPWMHQWYKIYTNPKGS